MKPLNYAILKYFTTVKEASADDVFEALKSSYSKFKSFNKKAIIDALMTAEVNGILLESRYDLNDKDDLVIYYCALDDGISTINKYIPN